VQHLNFSFNLDPSEGPPPTHYEIRDVDGALFDREIAKTAVLLELNRIPFDSSAPAEDKKIIVFKDTELQLVDLDTGKSRSIGEVAVTLTIRNSSEFIPFSLVTYTDASAGYHITDAAIADVKFGDIAGKLMVVYKSSEGGGVLWSPDASNSETKDKSPLAFAPPAPPDLGS